MNTYSLRKDLLAGLKGWMHALMHGLFINNYRKIVREQMFMTPTTTCIV